MSTEEKKTVEIEKPPAWAIAMAESQAKGFASIDSRLGSIETTVDTLVEDKQVSNLRMARIEKRMDTFEERADQNSMRAKEPSQHDLDTQRALADEIVAREALAKQVDVIEKKTDAQTVMLMKAANVFKDPRVLAAIYVVYTILKGWAERKGYL